jgi:PCO_ADO
MIHHELREVRRVAEDALALAANGAWSGAALDELIAALRPLRGTAQTTIEIGDDGDAAHATIFPLRGGAVLPLHDHPAMTVICKVLSGRMRIESFEWIDAQSGEARSLGAIDVDESSDPIVFGPEPARLHRIVALSDCTFLDLFAPWYDDDRPCRYYRVDGSRLVATGEVAP